MDHIHRPIITSKQTKTKTTRFKDILENNILSNPSSSSRALTIAAKYSKSPTNTLYVRVSHPPTHPLESYRNTETTMETLKKHLRDARKKGARGRKEIPVARGACRTSGARSKLQKNQRKRVHRDRRAASTSPRSSARENFNNPRDTKRYVCSHIWPGLMRGSGGGSFRFTLLVRRRRRRGGGKSRLPGSGPKRKRIR